MISSTQTHRALLRKISAISKISQIKAFKGKTLAGDTTHCRALAKNGWGPRVDPRTPTSPKKHSLCFLKKKIFSLLLQIYQKTFIYLTDTAKQPQSQLQKSSKLFSRILSQSRYIPKPIIVILSMIIVLRPFCQCG